MPTRLEKIHTRDSSLEQSSTTKINSHICDYLLFTHSSFDNSKSKNDFDRGIDCNKRFRADVKKHTTEITDCEKKGMLQLRDEIESYNNQKICHICKKC